MIMTNIEIVNKINELNLIREKRLPVKIGFAISKNLGKLEGIYKAYDKEREKLIDAYAEKDSEGNKIIEKIDGKENFKLTDSKAFAEEMQALFSTENDVKDLHMIDFSELEYSERYDILSVGEIKTLDFMIKE